jgi:ubiquinol-cytochrome c reductase cytochrome c subunit
VSSRAARRRPLATGAVILLALLCTGAFYALLAPTPSEATQASGADPVEQGEALFLANCASCHGLNGQGASDGPSLVGVGAAAVHFQVSTGRMPAYTSKIVQVPVGEVVFNEEEIAQLAAWVATLGPGPAIPAEEDYATEELSDEEIAEGGELFRVNCSMCHNASGAGGALTQGKYAPSLHDSSSQIIYEAMLTGPQSMPVFGESLPAEEKKQIVGYLSQIGDQPDYGGLSLGKIGPVSEGLFGWLVGIGGLVGVAVWLGTKSA